MTALTMPLNGSWDLMKLTPNFLADKLGLAFIERHAKMCHHAKWYFKRNKILLLQFMNVSYIYFCQTEMNSMLLVLLLVLLVC